MPTNTPAAGGPETVARTRELVKNDPLLEFARTLLAERERSAFIAGLASGLEIAKLLAMRR